MGILAKSPGVLYDGATSLVDLIKRQFGDDIDGATQELVRMGGFPESVARRIATGELPMDAESVAARRIEQGYGDTLYHGGTNDIKAFDGRGNSPTNDWGNATYLTDNKYEASDFYAGTHGDDFQRRAERRARELAANANDPNAVNYLREAIKDLKGGSEGVVYPLRVKQEGLLTVTEEFPEEAWEEIGGIMGKYDIEGDIMPHEHQAQFVGRIIDENGSRMTPEEIAVLEKYAPQGHSGVVDTTTPERYSGMGAGNHTVIFPGNENQIRSVNAAFDPQYKGSNIMGFADPKLLAGTAAGTAGLLGLLASEDADAGFVTRGGKTLLEAWHGSPHKFDRFSMDQIGTGEGAQAYGHGLYFADSEDVAREYRDNIKDWDSIFEMNNRLIELQSEIDSASGAKLKKLVSEYEQVAEARELAINDPGALYRTEIDVTPESLLDWDKPLSADTPQQMKDAINTLVKNNPDLKDDLYQAYRENQPGSIYYSLLSDHAKTGDIVKNQQFATQQLNDAGIKGIKYLDGDSRAVGDGTSNYVIFDDSLINIAERGNADPRLLAGTAAGTAGLLAAPMVKDSGMISAPRSETLFDLTMGARDLERRLDGSLGSLLFPSGLVEYLETVNRREEDPNAMTRGMALLDALPF